MELVSAVRYEVPAVGMVWTQEDRAESNLPAHSRVRTLRRRIEVLAASATIVTRVKIGYLEHVIVEVNGGVRRTMYSKLLDREFVLDVTAGELAVTEDGAPVSDEELRQVRDSERWFGRSDSLSMLLGRLALPPGTPVTVPPAVAARLFDQEVTLMELTFTERVGDEAHVALRLENRGERGGTVTETRQTGTIRAEVDTAQIVAIDVAGTITLSGKTSAEGTIAMLGRRVR